MGHCLKTKGNADMSKWQERTDEFNAVSEDGQTFHIIELTTMIDNRTMGNPSAPPLKGKLPEYQTDEGYDCVIDKDTLSVLAPLGQVTVKRM